MCGMSMSFNIDYSKTFPCRRRGRRKPRSPTCNQQFGTLQVHLSVRRHTRNRDSTQHTGVPATRHKRRSHFFAVLMVKERTFFYYVPGTILHLFVRADLFYHGRFAPRAICRQRWSIAGTRHQVYCKQHPEVYCIKVMKDQQ